MNLQRTSRLILLAPWTTAGPAFAQGPPGTPQLTPLPHPDLPGPAELQEAVFPWLFAGCVVAAVLLLAAVAWILLRRPARRPEPPEPPLRLAHRRLLELLREHGKLPPAEAGHRVSVILREYQLGRYGVPAPFRTREELYESGGFSANEEKRGRFAPLALTCDQLAFAPAPATVAEAEALIRSAIEALRREVFHPEGSLPGTGDQVMPAANPPGAPGPLTIPLL